MCWVQDGILVHLSGALPKEQMPEIAKSVAPVDPSPRPRIEGYQRQHPRGEEID